MAFAYFTVHLPHGFFPIDNHGEDAVMFCFAFLLLIFAGAGPYALDAHRSRWPTRRGGLTRRNRLRR
jgi:putative oxidoreductase